MPTEFRLYGIEKENLYGHKTKKERESILYEMVQYALQNGIKPAARKYNTYPTTIRRWIQKYKEGGKEALKYKNH